MSSVRKLFRNELIQEGMVKSNYFSVVNHVYVFPPV